MSDPCSWFILKSHNDGNYETSAHSQQTPNSNSAMIPSSEIVLEANLTTENTTVGSESHLLKNERENIEL